MAAPSLLVDLRVAQVNRERGIPRYCQSLVLALARERPRLEIACLVDPDRDPPTMLAELARQTRIVEGTPSIAGEKRPITHFLQGGLFEGRKPVEALFPTELAAHQPRLGAVVYDLIPWLFPDQYLYNKADARAYLRVLPALTRLDRLFALSESVRRDVIAIANAHPSRVVTIYGGLDDDRWPLLATSGSTPDISRDFQAILPNGQSATESLGPRERLTVFNESGASISVPLPFWLYVGGDDPRKNLPRLVEALAFLKREDRLDAALVLACSIHPLRRTELLAHARALGLRPGTDIVITGFVSDETLGQLLSKCMASLFPSLYEGLGLPVLESYAFGKPVLASDTSSFKEIVPASCRFDPYRAESIAGAMKRFRDDPRVAEESLAFAPVAIGLCAWPAAARKLAAWLDSPSLGGRAPVEARQLWVATTLPPDQSWVSFYTQRSLGAPAAPVTFFVPARGAAGMETTRDALARARHVLQREADVAEVLSLATLAEARVAMTQQQVVFVLGDSQHHLDTLAHLLIHGARPRDAVVLHDVALGGLLARYFDSQAPPNAGPIQGYVAEIAAEWRRTGASSDGGTVAHLGPRLLVRHAGVRHFIVNSGPAAVRLWEALGDQAGRVRIDVLFLPVLPAIVRRSAREPGRLRIGHFGILDPRKHPDRLIAACDILTAKYRVELIFAGYCVGEYLSSHGLSRAYLRVIESPNDDELEGIMAEVDCAVQLRYPDHGESSGVVNQLLSRHRPVICTRTGSFEEMGGAVHLVAPDVTPIDLAEAIERAVADGWPPAADAFVAQRSPLVFEARLRELLDSPGATAVSNDG